jgi:HK97 family phage major capsid protein
VPETLYANVMKAAAEQSIIRPNATVINMDADTIRIPMLDHTTAPTAGNTAFFGGIQASWTGEASSLTAKDPSFRQSVLTAHELTGYTEVDRTLIQNSAVSVDSLLNSLFGGAVAWYEDYSFLSGTGNGQPIGITKAPAFTLTAARAASTTITLADAAKTYAKMLPSALGDAIWVVSISALPAFLQMSGVTNGVVLPVGFYTPDGGARAPITTLLGRPVYVTEKLPALNTAGDFILVNPKYYIVGDRRSMEVAVSEHFKFQNNQIAYRFVHRVGGLPWINGAITLSDTTTTVSPFVGLGV